VDDERAQRHESHTARRFGHRHGHVDGKGTDADGKSVNAKERWLDTWVKAAGGKWVCVASASAPLK